MNLRASGISATCLLVPVLALATPAPAATIAIRGCVTLEGPQRTLANSPAVSFALESPTGVGATGIVMQWTHDGEPPRVGPRRSHRPPATDFVQAGYLVRWQPGSAPVRPFADVELGLAYLAWNDGTSDWGPGGSVGIGASVAVAPRAALRLDGRYHAIGRDMPGFHREGDLDDYYSLGLSLALAR